MAKLIEGLSREYPDTLKKSIRKWEDHHGIYGKKLNTLLDEVHRNAGKNAQDPSQELLDFPRPLVEYRMYGSTAISAILYYSLFGEIHPGIYEKTHRLGTLKDMYYAGTLFNHLDEEVLRNTIISSQPILETEHRAAASPEKVEERLLRMLSEIDSIVSLNEPVKIAKMHNVRKQLRGFSFMLCLRDQFENDPSLQKLDKKLRHVVKLLGDLHDVYVLDITSATSGIEEFEDAYAVQNVVIPKGIKKAIHDILESSLPARS